MADKDIKIDINVDSDTQGAKDAAKDIQAVGGASEELSSDLKNVALSADDAREQLEKIKELNQQAGLLGGSGDYEAAQKLREEAALLYEEYVRLGEATAEAVEDTAEFNEETERAVESTEKLKEVIEEINEVKEESVEINVEAKEALEDYIGQAEEAVDAFEDEAKAAQKMNKEIEKIRAIQQAQLLGEFARGLRDIARAAENNGMPELAAGLNKASTAFRTTATVIQGGLGISQLISQLGGLKASLAAVATFLTGPLGIALAVATAAYVAFEFAVKKASDEMDRFAEEAAKPLDGFEDIEEASNRAFKTLSDNIDKETKAIQKVIDKREEELVKIRQKTNELTAQVDQEEAIASAKVDFQLASGDISEVEALTAKRDIAIKFENQRQLAAQKARNAAYAASLKAFKKNEEIIKGLLAEREEIQKRIDLGNFTKISPEAKKDLDEITAKISELSEEKNRTLKILPLSSLGDYGEAKNLQEEINQLYLEAKEIVNETVNINKLDGNKALEKIDEQLQGKTELLEAEGKQLEATKERLQSEQNIALINFETFKVQEQSSTAIAAQSKIARDNAKERLETEKEINAERKKGEEADKKKIKEGLGVGGALASDALTGLGGNLGPNGKAGGLGQEDLNIIAGVLEDGKVSAIEAARFSTLLAQFSSLQGQWAQGTIGAIQTLIVEAQKANADIANINKSVELLKQRNKNNRPKN